MKLSTVHKLNKHIFRLLKVPEITYQIGRTPKGNLGIRFNENNDDFELVLDSLPLPTESIVHDENNIELKGLLLRGLFDSENTLTLDSSSPSVTISQDKVLERPKKNGNPKTKKAS